MGKVFGLLGLLLAAFAVSLLAGQGAALGMAGAFRLAEELQRFHLICQLLKTPTVHVMSISESFLGIKHALQERFPLGVDFREINQNSCNLPEFSRIHPL